jgi:hypothetical protein
LNNNGKKIEVQVHMSMLFNPRTRVWAMEVAPEEVSHSPSFPAASLGLPQTGLYQNATIAETE